MAKIEEKIIKTEYSEEMQRSYVDYAMSVIVSRALPDVRDGLKPVQRRTLYDMRELGLTYDKPFRKSARIVGDTMGKYHPHGDSSIYEALVVMSQDFKKGLPLVDGHGNFGTIEGDGAAAMRYTESRLQKVTQLALLDDLDKDTVNFVPNFDETEKEPEVLPCRIPNLLINGSEGIAVGMATSIPPHNFGETIDAMKAFIMNEDISTRELMRYVKGPDFPTGGRVINKDDLKDIYETGTGKLRIRGVASVEKLKNGHQNVVITEIPYTMVGAGIGKFLSEVAALSESKKTQDIVDISNQSSKEGIRIVIELKKDADADNFINLLYKKTHLEDTFGVNMLAIKNGRPETMSLKDIFKSVVDFQYEINTRKYNALLAKETEKKEIQEGLIKACSLIDLIIEIIRGSRDRKMAEDCLVRGITDGIKFKTKQSSIMASQLLFTERQAKAILDMRLYKLIGLEIDALNKDHENTLANIYRYEDILDRRESMAQVIIADLETLKKEFSRKRRTVIENGEEAVYKEKEFEEMDVWFIMDRFGYCKMIDLPTFERNKEAIDEEIKYKCPVRNNGRVAVFTEKGQMHTIKMMDLPMSKFRDKGVPVDNITNYDSSDDMIIFAEDLSTVLLGKYLFVTANGMCKLTSGTEFDVSARRTVTATKLNEDDRIVTIRKVRTEENVILQSANGYFIRFSMEEIPEMKKTAAGVKGIRLDGSDKVETAYITDIVSEAVIEYGSRTVSLNSIKQLGRGAKGTKIRS